MENLINNKHFWKLAIAMFLGMAMLLFFICGGIMWIGSAGLSNFIQILNLNTSIVWSLSALLASFMIIVILRFKNRRRRMLASRIPGPNGAFLVGCLPDVLKGPIEIMKQGNKYYRMYEKSLYKFWICNYLYIMVTKPEDIQFVLTNPKLQTKSKDYLVLQESIMGQGIFSIDDKQKWKNNRKIVSEGVNFTIVKSFIQIFYEEANVLNKILQKNRDLITKDCDVSIPISMATMEMIGRTAIGVKFNAQNGGRHLFVENLQKTMLAWIYRITHPWYLNKTFFRLSSVYRQHNKCQTIINGFIDEIITKKMNELNQNAQNEKKIKTEDDLIFQKTKTVIEILLGHDMSHQQIRDELVTIIIGGQETTAFTNACAIFMLAHHQDVQNKVFEEIESIFSVGDPNRQPTYEDLQRMEYLERVIKETLRLFPPLPVIGRSLDEEMQIGKYLCPAGSRLTICLWYIQTSTQFYDDPKKFNPDNFLPDACRSRHPYTYIPFSAGYRNCIGIKYAMIQMKTLLSTLVRNIRFLPSEKCPTPDDLKLIFLITLKFVDGCYVKMLPRTR